MKNEEENIFNQMYVVCSKQTEAIESIKRNLDQIGIENIDIPNIGITFQNKLKELESKLEEYSDGVDIYEYERYGVYTKNYIKAAKMNAEVLDDMIGQLLEITEILKKSSDTIENIVQIKYKETNETAIKPVGKLDQVTGKIKQVFKLEKQVEAQEAIEDLREKLKQYTNEYQDKDINVKKYKIIR